MRKKKIQDSLGRRIKVQGSPAEGVERQNQYILNGSDGSFLLAGALLMTKPDHLHSRVTLAFLSHLDFHLVSAFLQSPLVLMEIQCPSDQKGDIPGLGFIRVLVDPSSIRWAGEALLTTMLHTDLV